METNENGIYELLFRNAKEGLNYTANMNINKQHFGNLTGIEMLYNLSNNYSQGSLAKELYMIREMGELYLTGQIRESIYN